MRYTETYLRDLDIALGVKDIEALRDKSVLVTGASGLIGSAMADALLNLSDKYGYNLDVHVAGRRRSVIDDRLSPWIGRYTFEQYDAMKALAFHQRFDYIIHCASNAHPSAYAVEPVETLMANVLGTYNLLRYLGETGGKRLLYVSSSEVYGKRHEGSLMPYKEDEYGYVDILDPRSCYPSSKRAAETLCASFAAEHSTDYVVVRPGHVYGPCVTKSDNRAHAEFARDAKAGRDIMMKSAGNQLRSYCYVLDCVTAMLTILLNGGSGEAYNISNPNSVITIRQLAEEFARAGNVCVRLVLPTEMDKRSFNPMTCSALDSSKLEGLGWQGRFDAPTGAARTLDAMD